MKKSPPPRKPSRRRPLPGDGKFPLTVSRKELIPNGSDRKFRALVHNLFAFMARHEAIRDGHARVLNLAGIEYTVLISIAHLSLDGQVNPKAVAEHLHISGAFATQVTNRLEKLGLIEKLSDQVDRRRVSLIVTEKGSAALRKLAPSQRRINDVEFGSLTHDQFDFLSGIISDLVTSSEKAVAFQAHHRDAAHE